MKHFTEEQWGNWLAFLRQEDIAEVRLPAKVFRRFIDEIEDMRNTWVAPNCGTEFRSGDCLKADTTGKTCPHGMTERDNPHGCHCCGGAVQYLVPKERGYCKNCVWRCQEQECVEVVWWNIDGTSTKYCRKHNGIGATV